MMRSCALVLTVLLMCGCAAKHSCQRNLHAVT